MDFLHCKCSFFHGFPIVFIKIPIYGFSTLFVNEPRSDRRDLLAIKVKREIFTEKERPSCCEQLQKI